MDVYMVYKAAHAGRWNLLQYKSAKENKIKTFQVIQEPSFRWTMWSLLRTAQKKYMYCMMGYRDFNNCETKNKFTTKAVDTKHTHCTASSPLFASQKHSTSNNLVTMATVPDRA